MSCLFRLILFLMLALALLCGGARLTVLNAARGRIFNSVESVPARRVALVLGCAPSQGNHRSNLYFLRRIEAAAHLYSAGKVEKLLLSGDNRRRDYNEPLAMKRALHERGVPEGALVCDFAGRRTLDSVLRAQEIFGVNDYIIISQRDHLERALYLAHPKAIGLVAEDVPFQYGLKNDVREIFARVGALLDRNLFHTRPQVMGSPEPL